MPKPLHQKINKRILRLEFAEIAPPAFIPDGNTQTRFDPGAFYESVRAFGIDSPHRSRCIINSKICHNLEKYECIKNL